jgi:hypothetical protein
MNSNGEIARDSGPTNCVRLASGSLGRRPRLGSCGAIGRAGWRLISGAWM